MACGHEIDSTALMWLVDASKHQGRLMRIYGYSLGYSDSTLGHHQFQRTMTLKSSDDSLWMLDSVSAGCKFGLPQDHVFGFLSMMALDLETDYDLPWPRVFTLAASRIVEAEGSLRILGHLHRDVHPLMLEAATLEDPLDQVPSWVPFWSLPRSAGRLYTEHEDDNNLAACKGRKHVVQTGLPAELLHVRGGCIGQIKATVPKWNHSSAFDNAIIFMKALLAYVRKLERSNPRKSAGPLIRDLLVVFANTLILQWVDLCKVLALGGMYESLSTREYYDQGSQRYHADFPGIAGKFRALCRLGMSVNYYAMDRSDVAHMLSKLREFQRLVQRDTTIILEDGRRGLAMGRRDSKEGDVVCIFHGLHCPIIIRPDESGGQSSSLTALYSVVDVCRIDDCMDGQSVTWDEDAAEEFVLL